MFPFNILLRAWEDVCLWYKPTHLLSSAGAVTSFPLSWSPCHPSWASIAWILCRPACKPFLASPSCRAVAATGSFPGLPFNLDPWSRCSPLYWETTCGSLLEIAFSPSSKKTRWQSLHFETPLLPSHCTWLHPMQTMLLVPSLGATVEFLKKRMGFF